MGQSAELDGGECGIEEEKAYGGTTQLVGGLPAPRRLLASFMFGVDSPCHRPKPLSVAEAI